MDRERERLRESEGKRERKKEMMHGNDGGLNNGNDCDSNICCKTCRTLRYFWNPMKSERKGGSNR